MREEREDEGAGREGQTTRRHPHWCHSRAVHHVFSPPPLGCPDQQSRLRIGQVLQLEAEVRCPPPHTPNHFQRRHFFSTRIPGIPLRPRSPQVSAS